MQVESGDWSRPNTFIYPQYGGLQYSQAAQLLDLATLDEGSLKFSYSHLAAAALYHTKSRESALRASCLTWEQLKPCVRWLTSFANIVAEEGSQLLLRSSAPPIECHAGSGLRASVPNIVMDESHRIQTHVVDLTMLENAQRRLAQDVLSLDCLETEINLDSSNSPDNQNGMLTPPSSSQKNSPTPPRHPTQILPYT